MIPTVRDVKILGVDEKKKSTSAEFSLSKFRLKVNVINVVDYEEVKHIN